MSELPSPATTMRTLRFHAYGAPTEVLKLEEGVPLPVPAASRIRVAVHACGLNPADWALCKGLFPGKLPRGVGLDVAGVVDALGAGVTGVAIGDRVAGAADFASVASAGASDFAILEHFARMPDKLDFVRAAALPMAVETAFRHLDWLRVRSGQTILIHGAGSVIGYAAVQIALLRGARVLATAGDTYAAALRAKGALVTSYGDGMAERLAALAGGPVDLVLATAPPPVDTEILPDDSEGRVTPNHETPISVSGPFADLIRAAGGDPKRVVSLGDFRSATRAGARTTFDLVREGIESSRTKSDVLTEFADRAADGTFTVPVARTFALDDWRTAVAVSQSGRAGGKLVLLVREH